jgi:hypothetical protein
MEKEKCKVKLIEDISKIPTAIEESKRMLKEFTLTESVSAS